MTFCIIHWRDACIEDASDPNTPVSESPLVDLVEVGWLIGETDESVSIAMEFDATNNMPGRQRLHIPKVNITSRRNFDADKLPRAKRKSK